MEKRITQIRLIVWTTASLLTFGCFRALWPLAWQTAAFGALFTLLWPLVGGRQGDRGEKEKRRRGDRGDTRYEDTRYKKNTTHPLILHPSSFVHIGLDLLVTTILIGVSGGVGSPFAPLLFVVVLEAFALSGTAGGDSCRLRCRRAESGPFSEWSHARFRHFVRAGNGNAVGGDADRENGAGAGNGRQSPQSQCRPDAPARCGRTAGATGNRAEGA